MRSSQSPRANVAAAQQRLAVAQASINKAKSQIRLAKIEAERSRKLADEKAGSQREYDVRRTAVETTSATLAEAEAQLETAKREVEVARGQCRGPSRPASPTLRCVSPVSGACSTAWPSRARCWARAARR
jgi:HlyD family secretion protein